MSDKVRVGECVGGPVDGEVRAATGHYFEVASIVRPPTTQRNDTGPLEVRHDRYRWGPDDNRWHWKGNPAAARIPPGVHNP
jgi:hypothetical protein